MNTLPEHFRFSQSSLSDYLLCKRKFYLRYVQKLAWPAPITEPMLERERHLENGKSFHLLIQQLLTGIDAALLESTVGNLQLNHWWQNFLKAGLPSIKDELHWTEMTLSTRINGWDLDAKYDLIHQPNADTLTIYDWKTNQAAPKVESYRKSIQTRVYLYVLSQGVQSLFGSTGKSVSAHKLSMVYWFAEFPEHTARIPYSVESLQADREYLGQLINEITGNTEEDFVMCDNEKICRTCEYRSFCERGIKAGPAENDEDYEQAGLDELTELLDEYLGHL